MKLANELAMRSLDAFKERDTLELRRISNEALNEAAITQGREFILLSITDYALSKLLSKLHYQDIKGGFYRQVEKLLRKAGEVEGDDLTGALEEIVEQITRLDEAEGHYEKNVIDKARTKEASKLYERGLSLKLSAKLTGADDSDVLDYVGKSRIHESPGNTVKQRFRLAKEILK